MEVLCIVAGFLGSFAIGAYGGYYITLVAILSNLFRLDIKSLKWHDNLLAYRPSSLSGDIKEGDFISIRVDKRLANVLSEFNKEKELL